jgi:hypothetical protein
MPNKISDKKIWLVSINMGYGHQRTAYSLRELAVAAKNINANDYDGISQSDRNVWEFSRKFYEAVSGFKRFPILGNWVFSLMDYFQRILNFYPKRDLSAPTSQLKQNFNLIKKGWGRDLIEKLKLQNKKIPFVSTFFTPAFMAEYFNYPGEIFCVVCDADISRAWAPLEPKKSRIKYFAPTERVAERLRLYGVSKENIFFTGYPLPRENIGGKDMKILKEDLKYRLLNLDPQKKYFARYRTMIKEKLGNLPKKSDHPLTLMFAVGGAGAQKEIPVKILKKLSDKIKKGEIKIILVAGIKEKIKNGFIENIRNLNLERFLNKGIDIIFEKKIEDYFEKFNSALRKTDILWTKPSELSFYSALGLPIIIAPTIGSQEDFNKRWLLKSGFGISQENPDYLEDWLFDWIFRGYLAEAAMQAFVEGEQLGTFKISEIIKKL